MASRIELSPGQDAYRVHVGDELCVALPEAATGYRWRPVAHQDLALVETHMVSHPGAAPGDASSHVFVFIVRSPGEFVLRLEKVRPWAPAEPAATIDFRITAT